MRADTVFVHPQWEFHSWTKKSVGSEQLRGEAARTSFCSSRRTTVCDGCCRGGRRRHPRGQAHTGSLNLRTHSRAHTARSRQLLSLQWGLSSFSTTCIPVIAFSSRHTDARLDAESHPTSAAKRLFTRANAHALRCAAMRCPPTAQTVLASPRKDGMQPGKD
jgi:hypothetical protein